MKDRLAIYTAIYGETDTLIEPRVIPDNCDFYCFTDRKDFSSKVWKIVYKKAKFPNDPNRSAKYFKMFPHEFFKDYKISLWMDARTYVKDKNIYSTTETLLKDYNLAIFKHPERASIFEEAKTCITWKKDEPEAINKQIKVYKEAGFTKKDNLMMATFLFRKHHEKNVINFEKCWWEEILKYSKRDQLSFPYCVWKKNLKYKVIKKNIYDNDLFKIYSYKQRDDFKEILSGRKKIVIYTVLTNDIEKKTVNKNSKFDKVYFTKDKSLSGGEGVTFVEGPNSDKVEFRLKLKMLPQEFLPEHEYSIWTEPGVKVKANLVTDLILTSLQNNHISVFELDKKIEGNNFFIVRKQQHSYYEDGYKEKKLYDTRVIMRRNISKINKFNQFWYQQSKLFNNEENLSFSYALWHRKLKPYKLSGLLENNPYIDSLKNGIIKSGKILSFLKDLVEYIPWYFNFRQIMNSKKE